MNSNEARSEGITYLNGESSPINTSLTARWDRIFLLFPSTMVTRNLLRLIQRKCPAKRRSIASPQPHRCMVCKHKAPADLQEHTELRREISFRTLSRSKEQSLTCRDQYLIRTDTSLAAIAPLPKEKFHRLHTQNRRARGYEMKVTKKTFTNRNWSIVTQTDLQL
jgi:hypothetical protein